MTPGKCSEMLLKKLQQQEDLFRQLTDISIAQKEVVLQGKASQLIEMTADREIITRKSQIVDKVSTGYRLYWQKNIASFSQQDTALIRSKFEELARQLKQLLCADAELQSLVQEKMSEMRGHIGKNRQGKKVIAAYGRPRLETRPRFVSKLST